MICGAGKGLYDTVHKSFLQRLQIPSKNSEAPYFWRDFFRDFRRNLFFQSSIAPKQRPIFIYELVLKDSQYRWL